MNVASAGGLGLRISSREQARRQEFEGIWDRDLHAVFSDVAPYYNLASNVASLGLYKRWQRRFVSLIDVRAGQDVLDVCAGTNSIGIELLRREPGARVHATDRSDAMQRVGGRLARAQGFSIESTIGDAHHLPFADESFDIVTLGWASRHLRVVEVFSEVRRVLRPGGSFYHCDMLRPRNRVVEDLYCAYLKACVSGTALLFRSCPEAWACRDYFVRAIQKFYSAAELSALLRALEFSKVTSAGPPGGMVAFHKASKA